MLQFYRALGFSAPEPDAWIAEDAMFFAVQFGDNKINFHAPRLWQDPEFKLRGPTSRPGCGDFCFVWSGTVRSLKEALAAARTDIELGPVQRIGGRNGGRERGQSIYTRDPDGNLLEFIVYSTSAAANSAE
jgi:catechol 2,3-dioxygenase-like lactoylglutathione lyase family enzyme